MALLKQKLKNGLIIFMKSVVVLIICLLSILCTLMVSNKLLTSIERKEIKAPGQMVKVNDGWMHVYSRGTGEKTIVLLNGLGTPAPVEDFKPLIEKLSKDFRVVVVEGFGYGWSDVSSQERSIENVVEELRSALKGARIKGPYTLMPHSVSGVYSLYYANTYPNEVEAIIGINPSMPIQCAFYNGSYPEVPLILGEASKLGVMRLAVTLKPDYFLPRTQEGIYSNKTLDNMKKITAWQGYNTNIVDEMSRLEENFNKAVTMKIPEGIPALIYTVPGKSPLYEEYLDSTYIIELDGPHYLHWELSQTIANGTRAFLLKE